MNRLTILAISAFLTASGPALAKDVHVKGHFRSDGTYVAPHTRSSPNATKLDNYSTQGNYNPYSGRQGTVDPYKPTQANPTGSPYNDGQPKRKSLYSFED
jgi:hypothetical protein